MQKTLKDLGLTFDFDEGCVTCQDGMCHNIVTSRNEEKEYSVQIHTNRTYDNITVMAYPISDTSDEEIFEKFDNEAEAADFLCKTFGSFRCF